MKQATAKDAPDWFVQPSDVEKVTICRLSGLRATEACRHGWMRPDVVQANNYWCPTQLATSRVVYTCYDLSFAVEPAWTTEANRVGCFEGVFRAAAAADWVVAISHATREHFLRVYPGYPQERVRVIHPPSPNLITAVTIRMLSVTARPVTLIKSFLTQGPERSFNQA